MKAFFCMMMALALNASLALSEGQQIWFSASGGYTHLVPDGSKQTSKNGYHLFLASNAEIVGPAWVFSLGGGFFYNRVYSGGEREFATDQPDVVREQRNLRIETRAGAAEASLRSKFWGGHIEAGVLLKSLFGSSLSFSQDKDSSASKFFIGPQVLLKTDAESDWMQRVDLNLITDVNVPDRRVYLLTVGFALGRAFSQPKASSQKPTLPERYEEILADKVINFPSASSELPGSATSFLKELGQFLTQHPEHWQSLTIEGHTDKKGKLDYNIKLSQDRADAVRRVLVDQGVGPNRALAQGFGPARPLRDGDTPDILAGNRRVVMVFHIDHREGRQHLSREIQRLRKKHFGE